MSLAPYTFRPMTPPEAAAAGQRSSHYRNLSGSSYFSNTSPESIGSSQSRPSPVYRQHGPTLLPKIRTQDNSLQSSAGQMNKSHKRVLSNASNISTYNNVRPPIMRCATEPVQDSMTLVSPISNVSQSRASSIPPHVRAHSRSVSVSSVDESMLSRYGYPTYRQMPVYVTQQQQQYQQPSPPLYPQSQNYIPFQGMSLMDPPSINLEGTFDMPVDLESISRASSVSPPRELQPSLYANTALSLPYAPPVATTSLMNYLTQPTQPINLVRQLTFSTGRGLSSHFWWDVRNLRPWTSFSLETMSQIPDLMNLLNFQHENTSFPANIGSFTGTATPASEADLAGLISKIYFPKVNAAACLSLGNNAPSLYLAPQQATGAQSTISATSQPTFLANYPSENQFTLHGTPRGRVVGLSKSFDRWNTGMRHEGPAQRVAYLKGLSHLQKCMRDHSCRYGFIITEIELVCVRAGCDEYGQPYFGYLEVSEGIATKTSATSKVDVDGNYSEDTPLTASLALYFMLMLAKNVPLPGCAGSFMDVGGPGALTRQRVLPAGKYDLVDGAPVERKSDGRDKWMPDPQVGEKRDAKTARGWVVPSDPWHKREGGRRSRRG